MSDLQEILKVEQIPVNRHESFDNDDPEDLAMQAKLKEFMNDSGINVDTDDEDADFDDESTRGELDIPDELPDNSLDHVLLATCNWKAGMELFEEMTGMKPTKIGALRGAGSKSARVRLDKNTFVEIIGPDDKNPTVGMGPTLSQMPKGKLIPFHYAIRRNKEDVEIPESMGWDRDEVIMVSADPQAFDANGEVQKWDMLLLYNHGIGGAVPSFVNWREDKFHPTCRLPKTAGKLSYLQIQAPEGHYVHDLLEHSTGVTLHYGEPEISLTLDTPNGEVSFTATNPKGIVMPGFGDEDHPSMKKHL